MPRFKHPIIEQVAALGFPCPEDVVITHGSALVIRAVREAHAEGDVDIVTTPSNILAIQQKLGWKESNLAEQYSSRDLPTSLTRTISPDGLYEIYGHDFVAQWHDETKRGRVHTEQLKEYSDQDEVTGIWVAKPEFVRLTKEESIRQKDIDDIRLIDAYLQSIRKKPL